MEDGTLTEAPKHTGACYDLRTNEERKACWHMLPNCSSPSNLNVWQTDADNPLTILPLGPQLRRVGKSSSSQRMVCTRPAWTRDSAHRDRWPFAPASAKQQTCATMHSKNITYIQCVKDFNSLVHWQYDIQKMLPESVTDAGHEHDHTVLHLFRCCLPLDVSLTTFLTYNL